MAVHNVSSEILSGWYPLDGINPEGYRVCVWVVNEKSI